MISTLFINFANKEERFLCEFDSEKWIRTYSDGVGLTHEDVDACYYVNMENNAVNVPSLEYLRSVVGTTVSAS